MEPAVVTTRLEGLGASRGIAIGRVHRVTGEAPEIVEYHIPETRIEQEVGRFTRALETASRDLRGIRESIPAETPEDVAEFIDTHLLMLGDDLLSEVPINLIRERQCNAEWALRVQRDALVAVFDRMDDPYLRTRRDDIDHVIHRVQRILLKQGATKTPDGLKDAVVVAQDLAPPDLVGLHQHGILGYITEGGGPLSHTAILARSLGIPAVVGAHKALKTLQDEQTVIVDGTTGRILVDPDRSDLKDYRRHRREQLAHSRELHKITETPAITRDGEVITLHANIELEEDFRLLRRYGAGGVGLYRTEFLYLDREAPASEDEQLALFRRILRTLRGRPLTIRTLDLGADKECSTGRLITPAPNPALGLRAIRRCLKEVEIFKPQLRAILRAAAFGPIRLLLPMLTSMKELEDTLELLNVVKEELRREKRRFGSDIPVGAMIEVPAAALSARAFARRLDFLSIGTNDLIQYTLAIDRLDDEVNYLYDPLHPAVLRLIDATIAAGREEHIPVAMCGEMAGDTRYTRLLLGLGLREFSMPAALIPEVKQVVLESDVGKVAPICSEILRTLDTGDISKRLDSLNTTPITEPRR